MEERRIRLSTGSFAMLAFLTVLQIGLSGAFVVYVFSEALNGRAALLPLVGATLVALVDAYLIYWLIQLAGRWEPSEEEE